MGFPTNPNPNDTHTTDTGTQYYWDSTAWRFVMGDNPTGETGVQGDTGVAGAAGAAGQTGLLGETGLQGATGVQGQAGVAGETGPGSVGATGPAGLTGITGLQGPTGVQGATGLQGSTGIGGATGLTGSTGAGTAAGVTSDGVRLNFTDSGSTAQKVAPRAYCRELNATVNKILSNNAGVWQRFNDFNTTQTSGWDGTLVTVPDATSIVVGTGGDGVYAIEAVIVYATTSTAGTQFDMELHVGDATLAAGGMTNQWAYEYGFVTCACGGIARMVKDSTVSVWYRNPDNPTKCRVQPVYTALKRIGR